MMQKLVLRTKAQDTFESALAWQIEDFRQLHPGVEIQVAAAPIEQHQREVIDERGAAGGECDLFLCCTDWLPEVWELGLIRPLDDFGLPPDWPDAWHPSMQKLVARDSRVMALPWHDGPQMLIYRRDLFEEPEHQRQFRQRFGRELRAPSTWTEFREAAEFFTHPENDEWGCVCAGKTDGHNNVYDFLIQLWSRGGVLLDEEQQPRFHEAPGVEGLEYLNRLFQDCISPDARGWDSVASGDAFARGNVAMMWNWAGFAGVCEMPEHSRVAGRVAHASLPSGEGAGGRSASLNIYWALAICSGSRHPETAAEFIRHCSGPECDKMTSLLGANGTRLSTWRSPEVQAAFPHYRVIEEIHNQALTLPAIREYPQINDFLSRAVHEVIHEGRGAGPALARAAESVRACLRR